MTVKELELALNEAIEQIKGFSLIDGDTISEINFVTTKGILEIKVKERKQ